MKNLAVIIFLHISFLCAAQTKYFDSFDGVKIAFTDEGKGAPVILVHGFINSGSSWNSTVLKKELLAKGYRVITPDLRGNGLSDKPTDDKFYKDDAEIKDLKLLVSHLMLKNFKVVAYSRGSIITAKWLTTDKRIKKAVLGGMGLDFTNPEWDRRVLFANAFADGAVLTEETKEAVNYAKSIKANLRALHLLQVYQPVTSIKELQNIKAKVLVIAGNNDFDNGSPNELHKAIPKSKLVIIEGGHNDALKTESFSTEIMTFMK